MRRIPGFLVLVIACKAEPAPRDAAPIAIAVDAAPPDAALIPPRSLACPAGTEQHLQAERAVVTHVYCRATNDWKRNGPALGFDATGAVIEEGAHVDDERDGVWTFYRDGRKHQVGTYRAGRMVGRWETWYASGKRNCVSLMEDDETVELTCWSERGFKVVHGKSPGGRDDGRWDWWDEATGKPTQTILYRDDQAVRGWRYVNGKPVAMRPDEL
jgi:hypothetical protein